MILKWTDCVKFVFIDESFDEGYFILTAVVVSNQENLCERLHSCHKLIKNSRLSPKVKGRLLDELKANLLYKHEDTSRLYKKIIALLVEGNDDLTIICVENSICCKLDKFKTYELYKTSIKQIVECFEDEKITIFCDEYGEAKFREDILNTFNSDTTSIDFYNSCEIKPIQAADLFCSPIRKHKSNSDGGIYDLIQCPIVVKRQ
jgi:hypothetical protein